MSSSKRFIPFTIVGVFMFAFGCATGMYVHYLYTNTVSNRAISHVSYSGVHLSVSIPETIVVRQPYQILLQIDELDGRARTITGIRYEGKMLNRALQYPFTAPPSYGGIGNIAEGWQESNYALELPAYSSILVTHDTESNRGGPAYGAITVQFNDGSESLIPINYTITE